MLNGFCLSNNPTSPTPVLNGRYQAGWNSKQSQMKINCPFYILLQVLTLFRWAFFGCSQMDGGRGGELGGWEDPPPLQNLSHILH